MESTARTREVAQDLLVLLQKETFKGLLKNVWMWEWAGFWVSREGLPALQFLLLRFCAHWPEPFHGLLTQGATRS